MIEKRIEEEGRRVWRSWEKGEKEEEKGKKEEEKGEKEEEKGKKEEAEGWCWWCGCQNRRMKIKCRVS